MKKSLSLILAIAMVFSMFASVAFAAEATTTTTPKTTEEKYDALKALGIFEGDETGANLTGDMTRAQLAKIVTKLLKVSEDKAANTYTDVPADHWAAGFIGAATTAKAFDGVAPGKFDPEGKVSFQQLATVLVRLTGLAQSTDAVTGKVDEWAKGYVAAAVKELGLSQADYTVNANRGVFVELTFAALPKVVIPGKVSVVEAAATGVKAVTVKFNKPVDDTVAKLALTKGTASVATTTKFSEDKTSAVLTLTDVKVTEGSYTVTLSGLAADAVGTTTASFTAENEKVTKLSFINPSEKIAKSIAVTIKMSAENQYGEQASLTGGNYTAYVGGETKNVVRNEDNGNLELTIDTSGKQSEIDVIPVNVFLTNSSVSAQKTFKVGTEPYVTKIELGQAKYSGTKTALTTDGDVAEVSITRYDQYGDVIADNSAYTTEFKNRLVADAVITPYSFDALVLDKTASTYDKLKFKLAKNVEKAETYTATVYVGASSANVTIKTESTKVATKVEFGSFSGVLAEGDGAKYIPVVAYDAQGNKLSQQEIADNAKNKRFTISISGAAYDSANNGNDAIVQVGEHKGKIMLNSIEASNRGVVFINFGVYTATVQSNVQTSFPVQEARKPASIAMDGSAPATKAIAGGKATVKWFIRDQHGETLGSVNTSKVAASAYSVKLTVSGSTYATFTNNNAAIDGRTSDGGATYLFNATQFGDFNKKELNLTGVDTTNYGTAKLTMELYDNTKSTPSLISKVENSVQLIAPVDLTYSVDTVKDLYAALDNRNTGLTTTSTDADIVGNLYARKISVTAKDKAGDKVAIPGDRVVDITSSNATVAKAVYSGNNGYIVGNKAGTATALVFFKKADGTTQDASVSLTVKADLIEVATISADANVTGVTPAAVAAHTLMKNIKVVDNYGYEYKEGNVLTYKKMIGVNYVVENVKAKTGAVGNDGKVLIDNDGNVTIGAEVTEFVIKAVAPNAKSAQTLVRTTVTP